MQTSSAVKHLHLRGPWDRNSLFVDPQQISPYNPGIDAGGDPGAPEGYWTVENCIIENFVGIGINTGAHSPGVTIANNIIRHNHNAGIQTGHYCDYAYIHDNTCEYNGFNGIDCNSSYASIIANHCTGNGVVSVACGCYATDRNGILVAAIVQAVTGTYVFDNTCQQNEAHGIMINGGSGGITDITVNHNYCYQNTYNGIEAQASSAYINGITVDCNNLVQNGRYGFQQLYSQFTGNCFLRSNTYSGNVVGAYSAPSFVIDNSMLCQTR